MIWLLYHAMVHPRLFDSWWLLYRSWTAPDTAHSILLRQHVAILVTAEVPSGSWADPIRRWLGPLLYSLGINELTNYTHYNIPQLTTVTKVIRQLCYVLHLCHSTSVSTSLIIIDWLINSVKWCLLTIISTSLSILNWLINYVIWWYMMSTTRKHQ